MHDPFFEISLDALLFASVGLIVPIPMPVVVQQKDKHRVSH